MVGWPPGTPWVLIPAYFCVLLCSLRYFCVLLGMLLGSFGQFWVYFWVLCDNFGYLELFLGTLCYFEVLFGTLRYILVL